MRHSLYQSINQSINQSFNQSINQSIILPFSYDFVFLLRALLVEGSTYMLKCDKGNNETYEQPLLSGEPKILFKNTERPISIDVRFTCTRKICSCRLSNKKQDSQRLKGLEALPSCPFKRRIKFCDSYLLISSPLSKIIDNLHEGIRNENIPLETAFKATKRFSDSRGYSEEQFKVKSTKQIISRVHATL